MARYVNRQDALHLDLRFGPVQRAQQQAWQRVPRNLRQLGARGPAVPPPAAGSRGVVVKGWLAKGSTTGPHLRYLTQGKGTDGTDTTLFGPQGFVRDPRGFARAAQDDPHQCRWVVSAVDGDRLHLMRYTQALMRQVERDVKRPLDWLAATHRDTSHVHTHVVVRGRDRDGTDLYFLPHYLSRGVRYRAMHLATAVLGRVPAGARHQARAATKALDHAMDDQAEEAKRPKEDSMDGEVSLERFRDLLSRHDLTYAWSDDPRVRRRGAAELNAILALRDALGPSADRATQAIWNANIDQKMDSEERQSWYWNDRPPMILGALEVPTQEASMNPQYPTQLDSDPAPDAPPSAETAGGSTAAPSLLDRIAALREVVQQRLQQVKALVRDQGMGL